jgi:hypothetical protein
MSPEALTADDRVGPFVLSIDLRDTSAALRTTTERVCVDEPMKRAVCRSIMWELQREDSAKCERLLSVQVAVHTAPLEPQVAVGGARLNALGAPPAPRLGADREQLVGELVRGDLG